MLKRMGETVIARIARPGFRRKALLWVSGTAIGIITAGAAAFSILAFTGARDLADAAALGAFVVTSAAFLLTVVAAVIGVLAYAVSTGAPELQVQVDFPFSALNAPLFAAHRNEGGHLQADSFKQVNASVYLSNTSPYSARSPAVIVRLRGMAFYPEQLDGWVVTNFVTTTGATEVQWDGGATYSVHGTSTRRLPHLHLNKLHVFSSADPQLELEVLADGYRRTVTVPVGFKVDGVVEISVPIGDDEIPDWL